VIDEEKLVYRFDIGRNLVKSIPVLPSDGWSIILGTDTGWEDDSAFTLTQYHINDPFLYVSRFYKNKKMVFDDIQNRINFGVIQRINHYMNDKEWAPHKVIIDGANKQGVESMKQRSAIPFEYADKQDKATFIELCNSDLIQGKIKFLDIPEMRPLWEEMSSLVWMTDGDKIKYPKKEHPALPNHGCDSFLYAWRCGYHYASIPAEKKIVVGSKEWYLKQSEEIWERERERLQNPQDDWPEEGSLGGLG
jgi:hypothetical protein